MTHTVECLDGCSDMMSSWLTKAFSDAEWHNTRTGHDVRVLEEGEDGGVWTLSEQGWIVETVG